MPSRVEQHSHRSTTKASHKPFKSRKATKGALKEASKGRVPDFSHRRTPHQQVMSKFDRRNQARQKLETKRKERLKETDVFAGRDGAPRIVAVLPLCEDSDTAAAVRLLSEGVDIESIIHEQGHVRIDVDRFKQKVQFLAVQRDLIACLDAARVADLVICILSPEKEVDQIGELILRSVESQGLSTLFTVVQGLEKIASAKRRPQILSSLKSYITHFHPDQEKVHNLDARQECANLMRSLCTLTPKKVRWREERSWMLVDDIHWPTNKQENVVLTGVVRGRGLKADRLVQVGDWGVFQVDKITAEPLITKNRKENDMIVEGTEEKVLDEPSAEQDDLADLAPEEVSMVDDDHAPMSTATSEKRGVLLDDHHYFSDDETHLPAKPKRLPRGTSAYQAAWYLGDEFSDSGSDMEDVNYQPETKLENALPQDGTEGLAPREPTEASPSEYPQSEMFLDPKLDEPVELEQLAAFRNRRSDEAEEDKEFPDEIELHPNVLARERLARYRGLKSLRTSPWDDAEDRAYAPEEWRRLLQVPEYRSAKSAVAREALVGGVSPGTRVKVHIRDVSSSIRKAYDQYKPLALFSLLRHEHKRVVANYSIKLSSEWPEPIKSKEKIIMQCGPRRFIINPIFSQAVDTPNDVHKFDRYLFPGASAIATFIAPLTWGPVPALFFKSSPSSIFPLTLIATGTSLPPSPKRVIAKRVILTGHPYKIHKKLVTIRYMFFNREDVEWFKALQLWTKRGRSGFIRESLGTHGYFKALFDGKINPQDAVGISLYKRVWPRASMAWDGGEQSREVVEKDVVME